MKNKLMDFLAEEFHKKLQSSIQEAAKEHPELLPEAKNFKLKSQCDDAASRYFTDYFGVSEQYLELLDEVKDNFIKNHLIDTDTYMKEFVENTVKFINEQKDGDTIASYIQYAHDNKLFSQTSEQVQVDEWLDAHAMVKDNTNPEDLHRDLKFVQAFSGYQTASFKLVMELFTKADTVFECGGLLGIVQFKLYNITLQKLREVYELTDKPISDIQMNMAINICNAYVIEPLTEDKSYIYEAFEPKHQLVRLLRESYVKAASKQFTYDIDDTSVFGTKGGKSLDELKDLADQLANVDSPEEFADILSKMLGTNVEAITASSQEEAEQKIAELRAKSEKKTLH